MTKQQLDAVTATLASARRRTEEGVRNLFQMQASVDRAQIAIRNSLQKIRDARHAALLEKLRKSAENPH